LFQLIYVERRTKFSAAAAAGTVIAASSPIDSSPPRHHSAYRIGGVLPERQRRADIWRRTWKLGIRRIRGLPDGSTGELGSAAISGFADGLYATEEELRKPTVRESKM